MSDQYNNEPMLDMFIFETSQLTEQLEQTILNSERSDSYSSNTVNEIFRMMHTIKGSAAMMLFNNISTLAHSIEDVFFFIREKSPKSIDTSTLSDLVLEGVDFIKVELEKIKSGDDLDGDPVDLIDRIKEFLNILKKDNASSSEGEDKTRIREDSKHYYISPSKVKSSSNKSFYKAVIYFEDGCEMENIRAYTVLHNLKEIAEEVFPIPEDVIESDDSIQIIRENGFIAYITTDKKYDEIHKFLNQTIFLKDLELVELDNDEEFKQFTTPNIESPEILTKSSVKGNERPIERSTKSSLQSIISVNVDKLDKLMDLVGEMVISEAMVTQNPDIKGLQLDNFHKAARQLHKITGEIQDMVMSIRMVPLSITFHKMHRIVRDMNKRLNKEVQLELIGEETEVDKNIIEHISDPLMHLVRNAIDHGIEDGNERIKKGKLKEGKVTLEAKNAGSEVLVIIKDDGKGLNKEKILKRAEENEILTKPRDEMTDREIFNLIFLPGFSTKEAVSEFSGRGVGMDVVVKNIETVGGSVIVDSTEGEGTTVTLKIPLTLAIIDGMNIAVGNSRYTIPTTAIKESFRPTERDIIHDPDDNEMIMVRGQCYPIVRLHERYNVSTNVTDFTKGILVMVEQDEKSLCLFADELLGQQQVVVKALPNYIKETKKINGLAGCTLLGDGSISLILDIGGLIADEK